MSLSPSGRAAFKTGSQIVITDFVQSGDDLLLGRVCHSHSVLGCHAGIYVGRTSEPELFGEMRLVELMMAVPGGSEVCQPPVAENS